MFTKTQGTDIWETNDLYFTFFFFYIRAEFLWDFKALTCFVRLCCVKQGVTLKTGMAFVSNRFLAYLT